MKRTKDNLFHVHLSSSRTRSFQESGKGLFYSDMREHQENVLVNTVEHNKSKYSSADYYRAVDARMVQNIIGAPPSVFFSETIYRITISNTCSEDDI